MLAASAFLGYNYANESLKDIIFLVIAVTAGVFWFSPLDFS